MTTLKQLSQTTVQLLLEEPFYAHLLSGMIKRVEEAVPTLAVGLHEREQLALHVNPGFWAGLSEEGHRYGVLKHELLHIALGHLFLAQAYPHKPLFNIAADLVVNQYIRRGRLPDGALRIERFQELQLERHKAVGYYYQALLELHRRGPDTADGQMLQDRMSGAAEDWQQRHRLWHQLGRIRQAERDNLRQQIDQILRSIAQKVGQREIGKLPAGLRAQIAQLSHPGASIDWRRALRLFAASSTTTSVRNTIRRPSRRYGTVPGSKVQPRQKILAAIDSSGSLPASQLSHFMAEIHRLWQQRAEVRIAECDRELQRVYDYRGQPPTQVQGRGGTSFEPPILYANQNYHPDALVYFTDGFGAVPQQRCRCPLLWLISPDGIGPQHDTWHALPGQVIKMKEAT